MMNDPIADRVREIIAQEAGVEIGEARDEARLEEDLSCDSIDQMEITMALEEAFGIEIPQDATDRVQTVADAIALARSLAGPSIPTQST